MRLGVIGNVNPNTFCRAFVGTRAQITAANLANGTVTICTDEAENSIDLTVVYPVGSIYMNATDDTNSNTLFGIGTWSLIDSKFLYGANSLLSDLGDTGGSTTATLVQNNLPTSLTGLTISAMTGSTSTESTDHTHTTVAKTGNFTEGPRSSSTSSNWVPFVRGNYNNGVAGQSAEVIDRVTSTSYSDVMSNLNGATHIHSFDIPALTTGNQSEHSTHSHTVDVDSQTINLTNVGSGTSFSILPTYRKVAIWYRTL